MGFLENFTSFARACREQNINEQNERAARRGGAKTDPVSGSIRVSGLSDPIRMSGLSGSIQMSGLSDSLRVSGLSGSIQLGWVESVIQMIDESDVRISSLCILSAPDEVLGRGCRGLRVSMHVLTCPCL